MSCLDQVSLLIVSWLGLLAIVAIYKKYKSIAERVVPSPAELEEKRLFDLVIQRNTDATRKRIYWNLINILHYLKTSKHEYSVPAEGLRVSGKWQDRSHYRITVECRGEVVFEGSTDDFKDRNENFRFYGEDWSPDSEDLKSPGASLHRYLPGPWEDLVAQKAVLADAENKKREERRKKSREEAQQKEFEKIKGKFGIT